MTQTCAETSAVEHRAAIASVTIGVILLVIKFTAYALTGSTAIFSDALESIVNVLASFFALYAIRLAHQPADAEHPYGHGKVEFMSAGFEGGLIVVAALVIAVKAIDALFIHPIELEQIGLGLALTTVAMFANGGIGLYLIRLGKRAGSMTLEADGKHLLSDGLTSVAALVALVVVQLSGWSAADPIAALLMAVYIGRLGIDLIRRSFAGLMDEQDAADNRLISEVLDGHAGAAGREPRICSYHKLRHRHAGRYHWVDFHICVDPMLSVERGHALASAIEHEIETALGEANATAHIEPCTDSACSHCRP